MGFHNQGPTGVFFQCRTGLGQVLKKIWVAGGFGLGRSGRIFERVFPGTLFTLRYLRVCEGFLGILGTRRSGNSR